MRKRVAFKVVRRGMDHAAETMPYGGTTLDRAVAVYWRFHARDYGWRMRAANTKLANRWALDMAASLPGAGPTKETP